MTDKHPDWSSWRCRCSLLSELFTDPQKKEDKEASNLSVSAKKALYKAYIQAKWGRSKEVKTKQMDKGKLVQDEIMDMMSFFEDKVYERNTERRSNEWIEGECDCVHDLVDDYKASWEPESFIPNLMEPLSKEYALQMQGYLWLWNKQQGRVIWGLVDCPDILLKNELSRLLWSLDVASDEADEYKIAAAELKRNLTFQDVPMHERLIIKTIARDEEIISKIPQKVEKAREYLQYLDEMHGKMANSIIKPRSWIE